MDTAAVVLAATFTIFALIGAWLDLRLRIIPNWLNGAFLLVGLVLSLILLGWQDAAWGLAHFAVALIGGMILFAMRLWGGGDAKFYAAAAAWFPLTRGIELFVNVALAGLVLVIIYIIVGKLRGKKMDRRAKELPYGVAIAVGGLLMQASNPALGLLPY